MSIHESCLPIIWHSIYYIMVTNKNYEYQTRNEISTLLTILHLSSVTTQACKFMLASDSLIETSRLPLHVSIYSQQVFCFLIFHCFIVDFYSNFSFCFSIHKIRKHKIWTMKIRKRWSFVGKIVWTNLKLQKRQEVCWWHYIYNFKMVTLFGRMAVVYQK